MALENRDLRQVFTGTRTPPKRWIPKEGGGTAVGELAAQTGAPLLPELTPLVWDESVSKWTVYTQASDPAIYTITANATAATAGQFQLYVNGYAMNFAFDTDAATVQAQLRATLGAVGFPQAASITAVQTAGTDLGDNSAIVTITFHEDAGSPALQLATGDLTGNAHVLAATDAGTGLNGTNKIRAFVGDEGGRQTSATEEVQVTLFKAGTAHRDDINTAAVRAVLGGSPSEAELDTALRDVGVRDVGVDIQGLSQIH